MKIYTLFFALFWGLLSHKLYSEPSRPNIIFVMADDLGPEYFGCYGGAVSTPHIDQMAKEGVLFTNAWATPMCSPTRALVMSGRYPNRTGWYHNSLKVNPPEGRAYYSDWRKWGNKLFSEFMKEAGYETAFVGRWGIAMSFEPEADQIDEFCIHASTADKVPEGQTFTGLVEDPVGYGFGAFYSRYWHPAINLNGRLLDTKPEDYGEDIFFEFAIDYLRRHADTPSMVYLPIHLPHGTSVKEGNKQPSTPLSGRVGMITDGTVEEAVEYIDVLMGRLFDKLREIGQEENTIVILTADNASVDTKFTATGSGALVPLIIRGPETYVATGLRTSALISLVDMLPTWMEWAEKDIPESYTLDGVSQAGVIAGKTESARDVLVSYIGTSRMIRDEQWVLDAVDPFYGSADGILYYVPEGSEGVDYTGYQQRDPHDPADPEAAEAHARLMKRLEETLPALDPSDPYVEKQIRKYNDTQYRHRLSRKWIPRSQRASLTEDAFQATPVR
jgi:arylsulfatase A